MNYKELSTEALQKIASRLQATKDLYITNKVIGSTYVKENIADELEIVNYILQVRAEMDTPSTKVEVEAEAEAVQPKMKGTIRLNDQGDYEFTTTFNEFVKYYMATDDLPQTFEASGELEDINNFAGKTFTAIRDIPQDVILNYITKRWGADGVSDYCECLDLIVKIEGAE